MLPIVVISVFHPCAFVFSFHVAARKPRRDQRDPGEDEAQLQGSAEGTGGESVRPSSPLKSRMVLIIKRDDPPLVSRRISRHFPKFICSFVVVVVGLRLHRLLHVMWSLCAFPWCGSVWISITSFLWWGPLAGHQTGDGWRAEGEAEGPEGSNWEECGKLKDIWMRLGLFLEAGCNFLLRCAHKKRA